VQFRAASSEFLEELPHVLEVQELVVAEFCIEFHLRKCLEIQRMVIAKAEGE
jgi:hypothetical protein